MRLTEFDSGTAQRSALRGGVFVVVFLSVFGVAVGFAGVGVAGAQSAPDCSTVGYNGAGTTSSPYEVGNVSQLQCMGNTSSITELADNFTQISDIDASNTSSWNGGKGFKPIGESLAPFAGTFNGSGFTVTGLYIDRSRSGTEGTGLFGVTDSDAVVERVELENVSVNNPGLGGNIGALVGWNLGGTVNSSYATGDINGYSEVGGLVGFNDGTVNSSYATGNVTGSGDRVGGFAGINRGTVRESYATGEVNGSGSYVSGLVGNNTGAVTDSYWDVNTTNQSSSEGGTGLTTDEMKGSEASAKMNFDFANSWKVLKLSSDGVSSYPFLRNNTQTPAPGLTPYGGGDGTASNPYEIENWYELNNTRLNLGANFTVVNDLNGTTQGYNDVASATANGGKGFKPIGDNATRFNGTFNGSGFNITGLYIDRGRDDRDGTGLFGRTGSDAVIKNVGLENVNVNNPSNDNVGGLVGLNFGTVESSYATGDVSGSINRVGGLVGENDGGTVRESYSTASVTASDTVGGLVGYNDAGTVNSSYATGDVSGSNNDVGGLVGDNRGTVNSSYATGEVSGDSTVGGLVGSNGGSVRESYATGAVNGSSDVGGLVGLNSTSGTVTDGYWDVNATGQTTSNGSATGLTTEEMTGTDAQTNMTGFDFTNTWDVKTTGTFKSYPFLRNNTQTPPPGRYAGGDGSASNPYEIANWYHLNNTRENPGANFTLVADLNESTAGYDDVASETANGGKGFVPIGNDSTSFSGTFDGSNHTITGLFINRPLFGQYGPGLFGMTSSAALVENVGLEDANVSRGAHVGGLVGWNYGTINSSYVTGNVSGSSIYVGGLVGLNDGGTVMNSHAAVAVSGSGDWVGGLVGENSLGTVNTSYATGTVNGSTNVGGLVGQSSGVVENSYATSDVTGNDTVGGLVGSTEQANVISSYATGNVTGSYTVGGLVGSGSAGSIDGYWDVTTTGQATSAGGTGLTTEEMTGGDAPAKMAGFDFVGTWYATESYPVLVWQGAGSLFAVNVTGTNSPINETETLNVTANATNFGGETATQTLNLTDTEFNNTERDNVSVTLTSGGSNGSVYLEWQTQKGDNGTGNVTVASENETEAANVTVRELPFFDVNITGTNSPINEMETFNVDVNVTNTGEVQGTQTVRLNDSYNNDTERDSADLTLNASETKNTTLSWSTTGGDNGTGNVTVASEDTTDTANVTVNAVPSFEVNITGTNSDIIEGENLTVNGTAENTGDLRGTQKVNLTDFGGAEQDNETFTLNASEQATFNLTWNTSVGDNGTDEITVSSENTTDVTNVTLLSLASFDVNVTDTNLPVDEGEVLEVDVNATNEGDKGGTETIELVVDGEVVDNETLTLASGETRLITLQWQTESGDGGNTSISVEGTDGTETISVGVDGLLDRRNIGRGEFDETRNRSRELGRGERGERDDLRRESGRNRNSNRRDKGR